MLYSRTLESNHEPDTAAAVAGALRAHAVWYSPLRLFKDSRREAYSQAISSLATRIGSGASTLLQQIAVKLVATVTPAGAATVADRLFDQFHGSPRQPLSAGVELRTRWT